MLRRVRAGTTSRMTVVDHRETYGRHVLERFVRGSEVDTCVDLGCGSGDDLMVVRRLNPNARCIGIDHGDWNRDLLRSKGLEHAVADVEHQPLPFENESVDLIIANQFLEHTKEVFWINHEIFRTLRVGGHFYLGVPNVLSLHNRVLGIFGVHPTCSKLISAHIRSFSRRDTQFYYQEVASSFAKVEKFSGSQFYPFPRGISRPLSRAFPSLAFSIFFLIRKTSGYRGEFVDWLSNAQLETNYFAG